VTIYKYIIRALPAVFAFEALEPSCQLRLMIRAFGDRNSGVLCMALAQIGSNPGEHVAKHGGCQHARIGIVTRAVIAVVKF
jgi:hypothetical protein